MDTHPSKSAAASGAAQPAYGSGLRGSVTLNVLPRPSSEFHGDLTPVRSHECPQECG
jgi:hypothetical protein